MKAAESNVSGKLTDQEIFGAIDCLTSILRQNLLTARRSVKNTEILLHFLETENLDEVTSATYYRSLCRIVRGVIRSRSVHMALLNEIVGSLQKERKSK